jgi:hypothetical protein
MVVKGHAVAHVVSHYLPITVVWVEAVSSHVGFVVDKPTLGQISSTAISPANHSTDCSTLIIRGWYDRPVVAPVTVDWIPPHPKKGERF